MNGWQNVVQEMKITTKVRTNNFTENTLIKRLFATVVNGK